MTQDMALRYVVLCLSSGAGLGLLYACFKLIRYLLSLGKLCTALLDILFFAVSGVVLFLVALAADNGRLRFLQAALQLIGFLSVLLSVDPFLEGISKYVYTKISGSIKKIRGKWNKMQIRKKASAKKREKGQKKSRDSKGKTKKGLKNLCRLDII